MSVGCMKDHLGAHVTTWTPSGILGPNSDMIADCQLAVPGHDPRRVQKFMGALGKLPGVRAEAPGVASPFQPETIARAPRSNALTSVEMVSVKELRDRVGSVKNTKKITSAMKLVAAAKVRRAQDAVLKARPFSTALERVLGGLLEQARAEAPDIPLLADREVKKVGLVVMAGDRGLCGGFNAQVIKKAEARIRELKSRGVEVELVLVGNKAGTYFNKREHPVRLTVPIGQAPTAKQSTEVADALLPSYYAGDIDRVEIIYTNFQSMIATEPRIRTLIPLLPDGLEMEEDEIFRLTTKDGDLAVEKESVPVAEPAALKAEMIFEQDPGQLLDTILTLYLNGQLLRTMQESVASELAMRMQAMQSATDNANELQKGLELQMNRARQAKITQELTEIVAGATATR